MGLSWNTFKGPSSEDKHDSSSGDKHEMVYEKKKERNGILAWTQESETFGVGEIRN